MGNYFSSNTDSQDFDSIDQIKTTDDENQENWFQNTNAFQTLLKWSLLDNNDQQMKYEFNNELSNDLAAKREASCHYWSVWIRKIIFGV